MGLYKNLGLRKIGVIISEFITWTRLYGAKDSLYLCRKFLSHNKNGYLVQPSFIKYPVRLRDNYSDKAIFFQVFFEKQYFLFGRKLPATSTIIDGGANVGLASVYFSNLFPEAKIAAIEPDDNNFELLVENTKAYNTITCFKNAIWHSTEDLYIKNPETLAAGYIVEQSKVDAATTLKGITINDIIKANSWKNADIVKLDIEGAEKEIFSLGENDWIANTKLIIIELHDHYKENSSKSFFKALEHYEYEAVFHHENIFIFIKESKIS